MRKPLALLLVLAPFLALAASPAFAAQATFERSFKVKGPLQLSVGTGLGNIRIIVGEPNRLHVIGHVKSDWGGNVDDRVQKIANNPPILMSQNIIQIGGPQDPMKNMSIDYEIEAPSDTMVFASSGAGEINVIGVGTRVNLRSGSGDIHASDIKGELHVQSSTGNITVGGTPTADWVIDSGSGNIELLARKRSPSTWRPLPPRDASFLTATSPCSSWKTSAASPPSSTAAAPPSASRPTPATSASTRTPVRANSPPYFPSPVPCPLFAAPGSLVLVPNP